MATRSKTGLRPLPCWDFGLEPRQGHRCLPFINIVCCEEEVSATGQFLSQGSPTECVLARAWVWSGATATLYTYIDYAEDTRLTRCDDPHSEMSCLKLHLLPVRGLPFRWLANYL